MISPSNSSTFRMALMVVVCGLFHLSSGVAHARPQGLATRAITIPDGTLVHLYLMDDLSSKKNKEGDAVRFTVREDVHVGGAVIISAGSAVVGQVVAVGRKGFAGHSGKLGLSVDYAVAVNGFKVLLRGEGTLKGGSNGAVTAAATATYGPAALLMRGWDVDIHKGTMLNAYVNGSQTVSVVTEEIPKQSL